MLLNSLKKIALAWLLLLMPLVGYAARLGSMEVLSDIGEPLNAEISIPSDKADLASLSVRLAPPVLYAAQKVTRSPIIDNLKISFIKDATGRYMLKLTSVVPVEDEVVPVLLDVHWGNRTVHKYLVTFRAAHGKPVEMGVNKNKAVVLSKSDLDTGRSSRSLNLEFPKETGNTDSLDEEWRDTYMESAISGKANKGSGNGVVYRVKTGTTLIDLARQMAPKGMSLKQAADGIYVANPHAFVGGDRNQPKVGAILKNPFTELPSSINTDDISGQRDISRSALEKGVLAKVGDRSKVLSHMAAGSISGDIPGKKPMSDPALSGSATGDHAVGGVGDAANVGNLAVSPTPKELSDIIVRLEHQVQQANTEKERYQHELEKMRNSSDTHAASSVPSSASSSPDAKTNRSNQRFVTLLKKEASEVFHDGEDFLSTLFGNSRRSTARNIMIAGIVFLVLLMGILLVLSRRYKSPPAPVNGGMLGGAQGGGAGGMIQLGGGDAPPGPGGGGSVVISGGGGVTAGGQSVLPQQTVPFAIPPSPGGAGSPMGAAQDSLGAPAASPAGLGSATAQQTGVDPDMDAARQKTILKRILAEAEFYMSYGKVAYAEEILKEAIKLNPKGYELHHKLLSLYAKRNEVVLFEALAGSLYGQIHSNPLWQQIAALGRSIDSGNPLYAAPGTVSTAAAAAAAKAVLEKGTVTLLDAAIQPNPVSSNPVTDAKKPLPNPTEANFPEPPVADNVQLSGQDIGLSPEEGKTGVESANRSQPVVIASSQVHDTPANTVKSDQVSSITQKGQASASGIYGSRADTGNVSSTPNIKMMLTSSRMNRAGSAETTTKKSNGVVDAEATSAQATVTPSPKADWSGIDLNLSGEDKASQQRSVNDEVVESKMDLVTAYINMGDKASAKALLNEVLAESKPPQRERAQKVLATLG